MKRVATAVLLVPVILLIVFRGFPWIFAGTVLVVALFATYEYFNLLDAIGTKALRISGYVAVLLSASPFGSMISPVLFFVVAFEGLLRGPGERGFHRGALTYFAVPYILLPLSALIRIREDYEGTFLIIFLFAVVWLGDAAAFYVGKAIGIHKMSPSVSPGKSWEGAVASVVAAVIAGVLLVHYSRPIWAAASHARLIDSFLVPNQRMFPGTPLMRFAILAICINVAAQMGDLFESLIKREANVKDSGSLLPGHGGVLDRVDALLFAAPTMWALSRVLLLA